MHAQHDPQELIQLLGKHLSQVKSMLEILRLEHTALIRRDLVSFDNIVLRKQAQIRSLEEIEPSLSPIHALIGKNSAGKNMESFIANIESNPLKTQFQSLWKDLRETLTQCNNQNKINNRILHNSRSNLQQAIDILRGENSQPNLYGASGKQDVSRYGQSLAVA